ncbi:MAG: hypothetical protein U9Q99_00560 [Nanoarchaeota archaeon]|nr:hypothetical protein [Nanoarchaeota archaeon]
MVKKEDYIKVNHEIFGGIKAAIEHGADLKQAMMGFYRSGYDKQEIEQAAKIYLEMDKSQDTQSVKNTSSKKKKPEKKKEEEQEKKLSNSLEKENPEKKETDLDKKEKKKKRFLFGGKSKSQKIEESSKENISKETNELPNSNEKQSGIIKKEKGKKLKKTEQKVSSYEFKGKKPPQGKTITIVLILVLLFLIGILTSVVLFREELVIFFNNLFG